MKQRHNVYSMLLLRRVVAGAWPACSVMPIWTYFRPNSYTPNISPPANDIAQCNVIAMMHFTILLQQRQFRYIITTLYPQGHNVV